MSNNKPLSSTEFAFKARVQDRASRLFEDGYSVKQTGQEANFPVYTMLSSEGTKYELSTLWDTCNCPCHTRNHFCKHLYGLEKLLTEQGAYEEAQCRSYEESAEGQFNTMWEAACHRAGL